MNRIPMLTVAIVLSLLENGNTFAIPAFARKYQFSCSTCHLHFPKLKAFGEKFAGNGFRLPGKGPKRYFYDVGDPHLLLMRRLPLAVRFDAFVTFEPKATANRDMKTPYNLKLLSGGNVYKNGGVLLLFLSYGTGRSGRNRRCLHSF